MCVCNVVFVLYGRCVLDWINLLQTVRQSGITLLTTLFLYLGAAVRTFFEGEKPALLQQIDAECDKVNFCCQNL